MSERIHIEVYSPDGTFQGYLQHVSVFKQKVETTRNKIDAKHYAKQETAMGDCILVDKITRGCLRTNMV